MKKVLLLAAAVLTLGTATAHLGLNGTFGKPVSKAIHKVFETIQSVPQDIRVKKSIKAEMANFGPELVAPMKQMPVTGKMTTIATKAEMVNKLVAKAPAAINEKYYAKADVYNETAGEWDMKKYIMETVSFGEGMEYIINPIPDNFSGYGCFVAYTYVDNSDGTASIEIAPSWQMRVTDNESEETLDYFVCDLTSVENGGDGTIKMTLAADGNITFDNPDNIVGCCTTPANMDIDPSMGVEPPFVPANVKSIIEKCKQVSYTKDTFVAEKTYTGKGYDYGKSDNVTWEMQMGKAPAGDAVIRDLVPSVESATGIPTDVKYTEEGDKIIIQPQSVGTWNNYYLYICDEANGTITLTKDAEGHITTPDDMMIVIGAFTTDAFDPTFTSVKKGGTYAGYIQIIEKPKYYAEGQEIPAPAPEAKYEPASTILNVGLGLNGRSFLNTLSLLPAYAEIPYVNKTTDEAPAWSGGVNELEYDADAKEYVHVNEITGTDEDFSFFTKGSALFDGVTLTGINGTSASAPYVWGLNEGGSVFQYVGESITSFEDLNATVGIPQATTCNPAFGAAAYIDLCTPDLCETNGVEDYPTALCMYQGKPAAPLYITGLNLMVNNFTGNADFNLTARIVEAKRTGNTITLGETIAYADASIDDVLTGNSTISRINFNDMYVLDEDEMSQSIDHLFLDKEFAVVIDGLDNGTFSCYFLSENGSNVTRTSPCTILETMTKEGVASSFRMVACMALGFNEATYGYLHTTDNANFTPLADGGEAKIHIDDAMYRNVGDNDAVSPRVFVSDDCPEWVTIDTENVNETGTVFDLKFTFDKNDGEARKATFYVWQEGAKIDVTVDQAGTINTGISGITAEGTANGPRYNVAGQRVDASAKGIVISNGKKQIAK